jgi:hypothetical protein
VISPTGWINFVEVSCSRQGTGKLDRCPPPDLEWKPLITGVFIGVCGTVGILEFAVRDMVVRAVGGIPVGRGDPVVLTEKSI